MDTLDTLTAAGLTIKLSPHYTDPQLLVSPKSAVTPEIRRTITTHRESLIDVLYSRMVDATWPEIDKESLDKLQAKWDSIKKEQQDHGEYGFYEVGSSDT